MTNINELREQVIQLLKVELSPSKLPSDEALKTTDLSQLINNHLKKIVIQKKEQDAVFSSMSEGVVAIGKNKKIKNLNLAASQILNCHIDDAIDLYIDDVIKIKELREFFTAALTLKKPQESEFNLSDSRESYLQVKSSPLLSSKGDVNGTVFVLNDITKLKTLENHRRDFVANVSHELRTPLTSIQGFSETLLNQKIESDEDRQKFIKIIHKHSARLGAVIEDLLALSRLEKDSENNAIEFRSEKLSPIITSTIDLCKERAEGKSSSLFFEMEKELEVEMNIQLFEQALFNLIDNAVKYSGEGASIHIELKQVGNEAVINIIDQGPGIAKEHLPRLFERFYRVDKSRSRDQGGTGLGLAIVKHVCLAHNGNVAVESILGKGSKFIISLPLTSA